MIAIGIYLAAITAANLTLLWFGPAASIFNAFILIGLDLTLRDKLHDQWEGRHLWLKMFVLICGGSVITIALNLDALPIALASAAAFLLAGLGDAFVYSKLMDEEFIVRSNGSNMVGAAIDSVVFPTLAFGIFMPEIILAQFAAKVCGGGLWSFLLKGRYKH